MATSPIQNGRLPFIHPDDMPERYCLTGFGTCMEPLIPDGALIAFDKRIMPRRGDIVGLTFTREMALRQGMPGMIKRLVTDWLPDSKAMVTFEQINPPRTYRFSPLDLLAVHKFIGLPDQREDGTAWLRLPKEAIS